MSEYYILDGHKAVPASMMEWAQAPRGSIRHVANDLRGDIRISTVFLGLNHQYFDGPPLIFETMIFGGEHDQFQERCTTWEQAEAMHARALAMVEKT